MTIVDRVNYLLACLPAIVQDTDTHTQTTSRLGF